MSHRHYCGCGRSWRCFNEGCTEEDVCGSCAEREDDLNLEDLVGESHRREEDVMRTNTPSYEISSHWPTLQGLKEATALVLAILGVVAVVWMVAL